MLRKTAWMMTALAALGLLLPTLRQTVIRSIRVARTAKQSGVARISVKQLVDVWMPGLRKAIHMEHLVGLTYLPFD